jgi:DNA-binding GntR family transcriptional regulator
MDKVTSPKIVEAVTEAVVLHKLPPGTKLNEETLAEAFGVSRTVVRAALTTLAANKLVALHPGRGAFIAEPSVREAREVFEARRWLETGTVARLIDVATEADIARLAQHMHDERAALEADDVPNRTRLLGDFHVVLAEIAGNGVAVELVRELVLRTALISLLYQSRREAADSSDEHVDLMDAIKQRDKARAVQLMHDHLNHVENSLSLREPAGQEVDLAALFGTR